MTNSFLVFLHNTFGQAIDNSFFNNGMLITGIYPDPVHIGKKGIHLRWTFPLDKGFPDRFILERRKTTPDKKQPDGSGFTTVVGANDNSFFRISQSGANLRINFNNKIEFLGLDLKVYGPIEAKAYLNDDLKFISPATMKAGGTGYIEFQGSSFNTIELPAELRGSIAQLVFAAKGSSCSEKDGWSQIAGIYPEAGIDEIVSLRRAEAFFKDHYNVYLPKDPAAKREEAINRYFSNRENYKNLLGLYNYNNAGVSGPNERPEQQYYRWLGYQNALLMCLPDPNIARIFGLYYIDHEADDKTLYDYRITAAYKGENICAVVYGLGKDYDPLPYMGNPRPDFRAFQNPGGDFVFKADNLLLYEQHGSATLQWNKPSYTLKTNPVCFFLEKDPRSGITIRNRQPTVENKWSINGREGAIITPGDANDDPRRYSAFDTEILVRNNKYPQQYQLSGIDLFGRISNPIQAQTDIKDMSLPAPPVGLKIMQEKVDNDIKSWLNFSYGPEQYLKSPDAAFFSLYKKEYRLSETLEIACSSFRFVATARDAAGDYNDKVFEMRVADGYQIQSPDGNTITRDIERPEGLPYLSIHLTKKSDGTRLPARERMHFDIIKIFSGGRRFLITTSRADIPDNDNAILPCIGELKGDSRLKEIWTKVNARAFYKPPQQWRVRATNTSQTLLLARIQAAVLRDIPLFDEAGAPQQSRLVTELKIDRQIFRSGFLNNQIISAEGQILIIAQSSPDLLIVEGDHTALKGKTVKIRQNENNTNVAEPGTLKNLRFDALSGESSQAGKLLLKVEMMQVDEEGAPLTDESGRQQVIEKWITVNLLSDVYQTAPGVFEVLTILPESAHNVLTTGQVAYFFPDYRLDISSVIETPVTADSSIAVGYFALTTTDSSDQKNEGGLSAPVQHLNTITTLPPQVSPVYLCGRNSTNTEPAYVSLPNKEGRSTLCLQWDDANGSQPPYTYELSRGLDLTILSVAKSKWMVEDDDFVNNTEVKNILPAAESVKSGVSLGNLLLNAQTGLYETTFPENLFTENEMKSCPGCRIKISSYYLMATGFNGNKIFFRLLNPGENPVNEITNTEPVNFDRLADWETTGIPGNIENLKKLADACPEAFNLVTKVPVRETQFLDDLPGQGNGKFFYKVRAVDRAGNRSEKWSDCSMPFYQVDTRVPEAPQDFRIEIGDRCARLLWRNLPLSGSFDRFKIFRFENDQPRDYARPHATVTKTQITQRAVYKKIRAMLGSIAVPVEIKIALPAGTPQSLEQRIQEAKATIQVNITTTTDTTTNLFTNPEDFEIIHQKVDDDTAILIKTIRSLKSNVPDGVPLRLTVNDVVVEEDRSWLEFIEEGLEGGNEYYYKIAAINRINYGMNDSQKELILIGNDLNLVKIKAIERSILLPTRLQAKRITITN